MLGYSDYNDPGIRCISYFNGGDAIHAFNRASFGTPQSLGCVELPLASAAKAWPTPRSARSSRSRTEQAQDIGDPQLTL